MSTLRNRSFSVTSPSHDDRIDTLSSWEKRQSGGARTGDIPPLFNASATSTKALNIANSIGPQSPALSHDQATDFPKVLSAVKFDIPSRQAMNRGASFEAGRTEAHSSSISNEAIFSHNLALKDALLPTGVKSAFARAANVIRESVEVEGVIFFDASVSTRGGLVHTSNGMEDSSDANEYPLSIRPRTHAQNERTLEQPTSMSDVFAFSMLTSSSINGDAIPQEYRHVAERMIQWLLKRYPKGKVFSFRADGSVSMGASEDDTQDTQKENAKPHVRLHQFKTISPSSRHNESEFLLEIFPGARSIALTPLWDYTRERWFSLGIVWTSNPRRVLTVESDLSYLTAFGNTMMAEIARLDSVAAKKAKADLLGSISHEVKFTNITNNRAPR
jgi:hypothetical protein